MEIGDRFKLGVKRWGWDSDFRKGYQSLCMQLRQHELNKYFDEWDEKYLETPIMTRLKKIEKIKKNMKLTGLIKYKDLDMVKSKISENNCELTSCVRIGSYVSIVVKGDTTKLDIS